MDGIPILPTFAARGPGLALKSQWKVTNLERTDMTDWMNFVFLLITFGLGIGFVLACERLK